MEKEVYRFGGCKSKKTTQIPNEHEIVSNLFQARVGVEGILVSFCCCDEKQGKLQPKAM